MKNAFSSGYSGGSGTVGFESFSALNDELSNDWNRPYKKSARIVGDVMAVLVNLGRRSGIDAEAALRGANEKFRRRFGEVERRASERAIDLKSADFATLDTLWDEAKAAERAGALDSKS